MKKIPLWLVVILALFFAILMVTFAIQNNSSVELVLGKWSFTGSMAIMFLLSVGVGFLLSCAITLPLVLQKSVSNLNLKSKIAKLEKQLHKASSQKEESKKQNLELTKN